MKAILALALATTLAGMLSACGVTYEEHPAYRTQATVYRADPDYYPAPYTPSRSYYSRDDYYRHYNGIDG